MYNITRLILVLSAILILLSALFLILLVRIYHLELNAESRRDGLMLFYSISIPIAIFTLIVLKHKRISEQHGSFPQYFGFNRWVGYMIDGAKVGGILVRYRASYIK